MINEHIHVDLFLRSSAEHLTQLLTGYGLLEKTGQISLKVRKEKEFSVGIVSTPRLRAVVNKKTQIVYDEFDGPEIDTDDLADCNYYFKRSFDRTSVKSKPHSDRILPLGLNYPVYGINDKRGVRFLWSLISSRSINHLLAAANVGIRSSALLSYVFGGNGGAYNGNIKNFENVPHPHREPRVLFMARLWDPERVKKSALKEEREQINEMRTKIVLLLKRELGDAFWGGIEPTEFSLRYAPSIVVDKSIARKRNYLKMLRRANICIATEGLLGSNGWKLAEYVAGAKAIVSEKLNYEVPGNFSANKNYLEFSTVDECVEGVLTLVNSTSLRYTMMMDNFKYYHSYLRPDMLVWNSLMIATGVTPGA